MIPLVDLKEQYHGIKAEIDAAISRVLESSAFILGEEVAAFERAFAPYCGTSEAIGVNSGTSALHLALLAAGIGEGDEVITVPHTFVATVAAILYTGARPVFVDIDPITFTMNPAGIERVISRKTRAILPVHLYGHPADMDPILEIARRHRLIVIEDACQAHGAEYKGRRVGSMGDLGCFSFYPGKSLGACGEGGAVVTSNPELARSVRMLRNWGSETRNHHVMKGFNCRMEGMQGAILTVKLKHIEKWTEARRLNAARYGQLLAGSGLELPTAKPWARHVYQSFVVRVKRNRDSVMPLMTARGIDTGIHYPVPVHLQPAYRDLGHRAGDFPISEQAASEVLSVPVYPEMNESMLRQVASELRKIVEGNRET